MSGTKPDTRWGPAFKRVGSSLLALALGGAFVYAGFLKYTHPFEFAESIQAYRLVPESLIGAAAVILPRWELFAGLLLIAGQVLHLLMPLFRARNRKGLPLAGLLSRCSLLILMLLTGVFIVTLLVTMARGLKIDCGCGLFFQQEVGIIPVLQDTLILAAAAWVYRQEM